ncbi:MAG: tetratricopeptide repeat protein [Acidobacteria bacterium]|nr:tetratricopeptide repeat protein [Acidobacteriota bacterium]
MAHGFKRPSFNFVALLTLATATVQAQPQGGANQPEFIRTGQQLMRAGKFEDALTLYRTEIEKSPQSVAAQNAAGTALDLMGRTTDARGHFAKAIEIATTPQAKTAARRAMAMSYAFDSDCANTWKYLEQVFDYWVGVGDFYQQGEMLNEAARVCIEAGAYDQAEKLYRRGTELGVKEPNIKPDRVSLWKFRLEHALARLAARRGQKAEAAQHVAAAKKILDSDPEMAKAQTIYFPYLTGYVALYLGDYASALTDLAKANQNDAFIQCLIGMAHEKSGDKTKAAEYFRKAAGVVGHNPPAAYARWYTRNRLL